jgi:hypothetical protein
MSDRLFRNLVTVAFVIAPWLGLYVLEGDAVDGLVAGLMIATGYRAMMFLHGRATSKFYREPPEGSDRLRAPQVLLLLVGSALVIIFVYFLSRLSD